MIPRSFSAEGAPSLPFKVLGVVLVVALAEWIWRKRTGRKTDAKEIRTTLLISAGQRILNPLFGAGLYYLMESVHAHRLLELNMKSPTTWLLLFLGEELAYYWFHRSSHERRWLWATHSVHHSPKTLTFLSALRLGWTGAISLTWAFFLPLVWLGFPPYAVFGMLGINLLYQFWLHTESIGKLGWMEQVFNTPSHHRVHHSNRAEYLNKNFGGILILFDRCFGTFADEAEGVTHTYGIVGGDENPSVLSIVFGEWARLLRTLRETPGARAKLRVAFGKWE